MMGKLSFVAGLATGYVLGAKAGQKRYEQIKGRASQVWSSDPVQAKVGTAAQAIRDQAPVVADKVGEAARSAGAAFKDRVSAEHLPETLHRGTDGKLHANTNGFGPGPGKLP